MASVSYQVPLNHVEDQPETITKGSAVPTTAGDLEVRIDLANTPTTKDVVLKLQAIIRRLEDSRYVPGDIGNV